MEACQEEEEEVEVVVVEEEVVEALQLRQGDLHLALELQEEEDLQEAVEARQEEDHQSLQQEQREQQQQRLAKVTNWEGIPPKNSLEIERRADDSYSNSNSIEA